MIYLIYLERLNPSRTSSLTSSATPNYTDSTQPELEAIQKQNGQKHFAADMPCRFK